MVFFNYIEFFERRGINYRTDGPNVSKGHVAIHCPFCGPADPSEHMSVAINGAGWRCWRNAEHSGAKPHKLLMALGLTRPQADVEVGEQAPAIEDDLVGQVSKLMGMDGTPLIRPGPLVLPPEFRVLRRSMLAIPYINYLLRRGMILEHAQQFGPLYYAFDGDFSGRILFPVHDLVGRIMGWTGRHVGRNTLRYKDQGPIKDYLWRGDRIGQHGAHTLVLCEGPFDALKVSILGMPLGITATCCFTSAPSVGQMTALRLAMQTFRVLTLFDEGNEAAGFRVAELLPGVTPVSLPRGVKDPGELRDLSFLMPFAGAQRGAGPARRAGGYHRGL